MAAVHNAKTELPKADVPDLRLFVVSLNTAFAPLDEITFNPANELQGHWQICTPDSLARDGTWPQYSGSSGVGYFFGRETHEFTGQPVGLIGSYYGGTLVEAWTSLNALKQVRIENGFGPCGD